MRRSLGPRHPLLATYHQPVDQTTCKALPAAYILASNGLSSPAMPVAAAIAKPQAETARGVSPCWTLLEDEAPGYNQNILHRDSAFICA
eukprot:6189955-Pleurochrysis_carterae.AAC.14